MKRPVSDRLLVLLLCLAGLGLLLYQLDAKSLWVDELTSVEVATRPDIGSVLAGVIEAERRPPLYHLALHYWIGFAGASDFSLRLLSVLLATCCLPLTFRVGSALASRRVGLTAACLLAVSPTFVLYARMIRYYSLVLALGLLSCYCFLVLLSRPSRSPGRVFDRWWVGYIASSLLLVYADYPALALIVGQNVLLLLCAGRAPVAGLRWRRWLAVQGLLALATLPWLQVVVAQASRDLIAADLAAGPMAWALKLAFPLYSFAAGETIFPWHPAAVLGIVVVAVLTVWGLIVAPSQAGQAPVRLGLGLFIGLPILLTATIVSTVATDITFAATASRSLVAAPFFFVAVAVGLVHLPWRRLRLASFWSLLLVWGLSLSNYFGGSSFINPIYAVPAREMAMAVAAESQPADVVAADGDSAFSYYFRPNPGVAQFASSEVEAIEANLQANPSPRLWLVTLGRDRSQQMAPTGLLTWLEGSYALCDYRGYVEQDATYRRVKEYLLRRPAYRYKAELSLYQRGACT